MARAILVLYLATAAAAGPWWLCCCTAARVSELFASRQPAPSASEPTAPACCCEQEKPAGKQPPLQPKPAQKCPCKDAGSAALLDPLDGASAVATRQHDGAQPQFVSGDFNLLCGMYQASSVSTALYSRTPFFIRSQDTLAALNLLRC
jgi:hypothetical protein